LTDESEPVEQAPATRARREAQVWPLAAPRAQDGLREPLQPCVQVTPPGAACVREPATALSTAAVEPPAQ